MVGMGNLYLVGFMGAGKSSVGRALARRLAWRFVDLDDRLEERFGMSIPEVFERLGEERFRAAEREALQWSTTLAGAVIATGGGAFCSAANRAIIHGPGGRSVFLDLPWQAVLERLADDHGQRPKFTGEEAARRLYEGRRPHYLKATWTVELDGSEGPEAAAELILGLLAGAPCDT